MKKWLVPLAYPLFSVMAVLFSGAVGVSNNSHDTGYGGLVMTLVGLILYCVIVIPAMCILYAKYCLSGQRFRFLFTLYQSVFIGLPYFVFCLLSRDMLYIAYSAILFAWCETWGLIGLIRWKRKKQQP